MPPDVFRAPSWDTATSRNPADSMPMELHSLGEHVAQCGSRRGALPWLNGALGRLQGMLAARVVTAAVLVALLAGLFWLAS